MSGGRPNKIYREEDALRRWQEDWGMRVKALETTDPDCDLLAFALPVSRACMRFRADA